ncbi:MAG: CHAT domain-containing protein [Chitinophagaceae bacterium]|nr:CHAT domain-containing protein [Chitinophagaceae bacterium]
MIMTFLKRIVFPCLFVSTLFSANAQTQDDFTNKLTDIYLQAADKKKVLSIAREMYAMLEKKKDLQTYSNYYLLKQIFENQAPDPVLAKKCDDKADKLMRELVGKDVPTHDFGVDSLNQWFNVIFPGLFATTDPLNATKAVAFINKYPSYKSFSNYTYIGYAFERNGDFQKAKEHYEMAVTLKGNEKEEYHSYSYYIGFLARSGEYLKAEEYIRKLERLSEEAIDMLRPGYKSEAMTSKLGYYLAIGDFNSYATAADQQYEYFSKTIGSKLACDPYTGTRYTVTAYAKEMLKDYTAADRLWKSSDSANAAWRACMKEQYPNLKQYSFSHWPVFLIMRGKRSQLPQPVNYYIKETETYYNSFSKYADMGINFMKAVHMAFLGNPQYPAIFKPLLDQIKTTRNFRESTEPFAQYAYFSMRDRELQQSIITYNELFQLNAGWINDIIFSFGEKAFVTYYNSRLKSGYENFHSFVKISKEKNPAAFPGLASQDYNNLLFTKSISLKGTQKRKEVFLKTNDPAIHNLYDQWIEKKQQLIRQFFKSEDPSVIDTVTKINQQQLGKLQEEVNHLENELVTKAKDFKKYLKITPPDWKEVRDRLQEGEAAIEMIRFNWRDQVYYSDTAYYAAYIITKNCAYPEVVYLPDLAAVLDNKFYKQYRNSIKQKTDDKESYDHFWKPIGEKLTGIKKVYFSPDGIYHLINIASLKNPESRQFLLDELEIQYTTSGTDIRQRTTDTKDIRTAVLFGRPAYKTGDPITFNDSVTNTRSFIRNFKDNNIPDLPGTEVEVLAIKTEMDLKKIGVNLNLKEQASEDKVYLLHSPDVLHIATHGYWSPAGENATEGYRVFNAMAHSGLLLSGVVNYYAAKEYPNTYDGILTAYEAQNLDLENTSLVILSACETSLGYLDAGEGVYGLQRAFRSAGAESIITSLWKVDDNATKDFMIAFYRQYLKTKDKSAAFLGAQKAIREKYIQPYFWGAFVMMGE